MQHGPSMHMGSSAKKIASYEVALKDKKQIAEGTFSFVFEKPKGFQFIAGQHIRMTLINPVETDSEGNSRFLSFASTPTDADLVFALRMRDTAFKRVLGNMQIGEKVLIQMRLDNPHGSFALENDTNRSQPAVFLIGGIGIVPVFSMIKDALEKKLPRKIFLFYSNRRPEDAPFLHELEELAKQNPSFKLIATMTTPEKSKKLWEGETGVINQTMVKKYVDDLQSSMYYIAGMPEMVKAMQQILRALNIKTDNIRAEEFGSFKMDHTNEGSKPKKRSHILIGAIVLVIIVMVFVHISAGFSLYKTGFGIFSLTNPMTYTIVGILLVVVLFKFKYLSAFMHKKRKE